MRKLLSIGLLLLLAGAAATESQAQTGFRRIEDEVYSRKFVTALTLDVFQPEQPNGRGILFMVSGGVFAKHLGLYSRVLHRLADLGEPRRPVVTPLRQQPQ